MGEEQHPLTLAGVIAKFDDPVCRLALHIGCGFVDTRDASCGGGFCTHDNLLKFLPAEPRFEPKEETHPRSAPVGWESLKPKLEYPHYGAIFIQQHIRTKRRVVITDN